LRGVIVTDGSIKDGGPDVVSATLSLGGVSASESGGISASVWVSRGVSASLWASSSAADWGSGGTWYEVWGISGGPYEATLLPDFGKHVACKLWSNKQVSIITNYFPYLMFMLQY